MPSHIRQCYSLRNTLRRPRCLAHVFDGEYAIPPSNSYLICGTPRGGTTFLCEALINTGLAGRPKEYFNTGDILYWSQRWGIPASKLYLERTVEKASTPNGVFGAKIFVQDLDAITSMVRDALDAPDLSVSEALPAYFPNLHLVWITRRDKVRQAISNWKLWKTHVSYQTDGVTPKPRKRPQYNYTRIDRMLQTIILDEARWAALFAEMNAIPHTVVYEDLAADYDGVLDTLLEYLEIEVPAGWEFAASRLKKQGDIESENWARRYLEAKSAPFSVNLPALVVRSVRDMLQDPEEVVEYARRRLFGKSAPQPEGYDWAPEHGTSNSNP